MHRMNQEDAGTSNPRGFTLVELAIVITIIGLLIGGVLKGQEMINNAKITATISQVKSYQAALETFRDRFDQIPGDMIGAQRKLPGCTATTYCVDGDGDGRVGVPNYFLTQQLVNSAPRVETQMFFKHLALADLISGVNPSSNPATPVWGKTHPAAPIAGGWNVFFTTAGTAVGSALSKSGHYLRLQNPLSGTTAFAHTGACNLGTGGNLCQPVEAISPRDAAVIDRKLDDGRAMTGDVISDDAGTNSSPCENYGTTGYDEREISRLCVMFFRL